MYSMFCNFSDLVQLQEGISLLNPEKEGFLVKEGHVLKNWKKRWFVLKNDTLFYFPNSNVRECGTTLG